MTIVHYCGRSAPCGLSWLRLTPCMVNKRGRRTSDSGTLSFPQNSLSAMPEVFRKIKLCNRRFCLNRRFPTSFPGSQSNNELQTPESKVWEGISDGLCAIGDWCQYQTNATRNVFFLFSGHVLWQILRSYMSSPLWAGHEKHSTDSPMHCPPFKAKMEIKYNLCFINALCKIQKSMVFNSKVVVFNE